MRSKSNIYKYLETFWDGAEMYMHVNDLLYPHKNGLTTMQYIVGSRMIDTKMWLDGWAPIWFLTLGNINGNEQIYIDQYERFLNRLHQNGFNHKIGKISVRQKPYWGLYDGTHRLGYLLATQKNPWIHVRISNSMFKQKYAENGREFFLNKGVSNLQLNQIENFYKKIFNDNRVSLIAWLYNDDVFKNRRQQILDIFTKVGKVDDIKMYSQLEYKKICIVTFRLNYQSFYLRRRQLRSHIVDYLHNALSAILGKDFGGISPSVTDSVIMESKLVSCMANVSLI